MAESSDAAQEPSTLHPFRQSVNDTLFPVPPPLPEVCDNCGCTEYVHRENLTLDVIDEDGDVAEEYISGRKFACARAHSPRYGWIGFCNEVIESAESEKPPTIPDTCDICGDINHIDTPVDTSLSMDLAPASIIRKFKCEREFHDLRPTAFCAKIKTPKPPVASHVYMEPVYNAPKDRPSLIGSSLVGFTISGMAVLFVIGLFLAMYNTAIKS